MIALAMILSMWIGVRVTLLGMDGATLRHPFALGEVEALHLVPPDRRSSKRRAAAMAPKRQSLSTAGHARGSSPAATGPAARRKSARLLWSLLAGPEVAGAGMQGMPFGEPSPFAPGLSPAQEPAGRRRSRWSADGWVLIRQGTSAPALAAGASSYGGSQMGAVLRYDLAPGSGLRPQVYVRAAGALAATVRDPEGAVGLMMRPSRRLPLSVMGELRLQQGSGPVRVRPVISAVTQIPPLRLPFASEAEVYAQAGWAGGRDTTAFYDASAVAERRVLRLFPGGDLRAGVGAWSGGQRGAARLDVGPRLEWRGLLGPQSYRPVGVRIAVDWRFRVAGQAEPGSGPAVTVAAGF